MATYLLIFEQKEDGCDYTIGCGVHIHDLKTREFTDARDTAQHLINSWENYFERGNDSEVDKAYLVQVKTRWDVEEVKNNQEEARRLAQERAENKTEYNEYMRLKAKFDPEPL